MSASSRSHRFEHPGRVRAAIAGGIGGLAGTILFGLLLWLASPEIITESIPAFYALPAGATTGWTLHLVHGVVLGVIFGLVARSGPVFDVMTGPVATDAIEGLGAPTRFGLLGLVYGIAIWTLVPFIGLSLLGGLGGVSEGNFSHLGAEMILGHVVFGTIVGVTFSMVVEERTS